MGVFLNLIDAILFFFFTIVAIFSPLIDLQICLPTHLYPEVLLDFKSWFSREFGYYLIDERPNFFVGLAWLELLFGWPLSLLSLYGILWGKSWLRTTCLIYGVSTFTSMIAILSEMVGSQKADKLFMLYFPFMGFAVLSVLRGLLPYSGKTTAAGRRPGLNKKNMG